MLERDFGAKTLNNEITLNVYNNYILPQRPRGSGNHTTVDCKLLSKLPAKPTRPNLFCDGIRFGEFYNHLFLSAEKWQTLNFTPNIFSRSLGMVLSGFIWFGHLTRALSCKWHWHKLYFQVLSLLPGLKSIYPVATLVLFFWKTDRQTYLHMYVRLKRPSAAFPSAKATHEYLM